MATPIPVIDGHGYIFDVEVLKTLREQHSIPGVLCGTLPQFPQQNIFNGLPLRLLPEELRLLLESGEYCAVDAVRAHEQLLPSPSTSSSSSSSSTSASSTSSAAAEPGTGTAGAMQVSTLPQTPQSQIGAVSSSTDAVEPDPARYAVFRHLLRTHRCFLLPGLRFGCDYMAYPDDPMRYHSHYNVVCTEFAKPFRIIDVVNGGRLATSVKKCWVVGARRDAGADNKNADGVEVFSIEWAGFG